MSFIDRIVGRFVKKESERAVSFSVQGSNTWTSRTYSYAQLATVAYKSLVLGRRCIDLRGNAYAEAPLMVYRSADDEPVPEHPLVRFVETENANYLESELLSSLLQYCDIGGDAYLLKIRDRLGRIVELIPWRPDLVTIKADPVEYVSGYEVYNEAGTSWLFPSKDVVHFRLQSDPLNSYYGEPLLTGYTKTMSIADELDKFVYYVLANMASVSGILSVKNKMDAKVWEPLKEQFIERFTGTLNAGKILPLNGEIEFTKTSMNLNEINSTELQNRTDANICLAYGVPPVVVGAQVGLANSPWSKYSEARKSFYDDTISPIWTYSGQILTRDLLPDFEQRPDMYYVAHDRSAVQALEDDNDTLFNRSTNAAGILTINERRRIIGLEDLPGSAGEFVAGNGYIITDTGEFLGQMNLIELNGEPADVTVQPEPEPGGGSVGETETPS